MTKRGARASHTPLNRAPNEIQPVRLAGSYRCWFVKKYCWLVYVREKYCSSWKFTIIYDKPQPNEQAICPKIFTPISKYLSVYIHKALRGVQVIAQIKWVPQQEKLASLVRSCSVWKCRHRCYLACWGPKGIEKYWSYPVFHLVL